MIGNKTRLSLAVSMAVFGLQAHAQGALVLEEITVTAQRTVEMAQEVPVTVNVITGETYQRLVNFDFEDVGKLTPGLNLESTGNNQNITIRGVGTKIRAAQTPRTNVYMDGSLVPNQQISFFSQFDLQRIEVLRGPQGTLYGKASPTGTIVMHTQNPDLTQTEGFVQATLGQYDLFNTQFGISIPLIENELGLRIAGVYDENNNTDASYGNLPQDPLRRGRGARATLLWLPADLPIDARLSHTYFEVNNNVPSRFSETDTVSRYDRKNLGDEPRYEANRFNQTILEVNYHMDWATLTSQSLFAHGSNRERLDFDYTDIPQRVQDTHINFNKLFNTELRLASSGNEFWDWMAGIYYANNRADTNVDTIQTVMSVDGAFNWQPLPLLTEANLLSSSEDWGIFTHNTLFLHEDWTLTLGARWSDERRGSDNAAFTFIQGGGPMINSREVSTPTRYIAWTGTAKLSWHIAPDQTLFFTYDRGGRSGGQSLDLAGTLPEELAKFDPETSDSVELGYKSELLDRRLRFNAAIYYQRYQDYHVQHEGIVFESGAFQGRDFTVIRNANEVISKGAEIDITYVFSHNLTGSLAVSYNDAKFDDYKRAPCNDPSGDAIVSSLGTFRTCDRSGNRVGGDTGNWSAVAMANYVLPIEAIGSEWYVDGLYNFNSHRRAQLTQRRSASFATFDLFTGLRSMEGTWDVKFWVKNLFDKEATVTDEFFEPMVADLSMAGQSVMSGPGMIGSGAIPHERVVNPRQFGVTGLYRF